MQVKAKLEEAGDFAGKQLPAAGARVGKGTAVALKGAMSDQAMGNPVKEALESVEKVCAAILVSVRLRMLFSSEGGRWARRLNFLLFSVIMRVGMSVFHREPGTTTTSKCLKVLPYVANP